MNTSDWIAIIALVVASGALALEVRRWFEAKPRLHLSVMADAIEFPDDDGKPKLWLTVTNRGAAPTVLTHMVAFVYRSRWQRFRNRPEFGGIVKEPGIPHELGVNQLWMGKMYYSETLADARRHGRLHVGVVASHSNLYHLIHVPTQRDNHIPQEEV